MKESKKFEVVLFAGGVGGAKLAEGLINIKNINLSIICNIGDDEEFHGLHVSPDVDTMIYTLSGFVNKKQGWGVKNDQYRALNVLKKLGEKTWMLLGDSDFGLHIYRSKRLMLGHKLSDITNDISKAFNLKCNIILPTDMRVPTKIKTKNSWLTFQEYFVQKRCIPKVEKIEYNDINNIKPNPDAIKAISSADLIVLAPSNPLLSLLPIISIPNIKSTILGNRNAPKIAISPLIGGKAVKGPANKIMKEMKISLNSIGVSKFYKEFLDILVIHNKDKKDCDDSDKKNVNFVTTNTLMKTKKDKINLAKFIINQARIFMSKK